MKNIEKEQVDQLLQMIEDKPGQRIVHFSDEDHIITQQLSLLAAAYKSEYFLNCCTDVFYENSLRTYSEQPQMHIRKFALQRPRYKMQGIEYDYLIATLDFSKEDKKSFLQKCYPIIRTGGNILIFIPNSSYDERDEWRDILEEQYYVSTTIVDDLFEECDVIISKRMHGWGD